MRLALALLGALVPAVAAATPSVAMNGHVPSDADCAAMQQLGAVAVRMDFNWFQFNPQQGVWDWSVLDAAVASAQAHGLRVYATVAYTPAWAASPASCVQNSGDPTTDCNNKLPAQSSYWTDALTQVVTRYAGQVECWGLWNEPNLRGFFDGSEDDFVNGIFVPGAAAVRAADGSAKVCGPELSGLTSSSNWNGTNGQCIGSSCIRNGWEIDLGDMLDRVGSQIDVVTQHMYKSDAPSVIGALLDGESFGGVLTHDAVRHVIQQHGAGNKEFWLTESGWEHQPQGSLTVDQVATDIVALFDGEEQVCAGTWSASTNDPWAQWTRTYYYHFPYDPNSGWGIVDVGDAPLAPYTALQQWTSSHPTTNCMRFGAPPDMATAGTDASLSNDGSATSFDASSTARDQSSAITDGGTRSGDAAPAASSTSGCACTVGARPSHRAPTVALALLALVAISRRRRFFT